MRCDECGFAAYIEFDVDWSEYEIRYCPACGSEVASDD